MATTAVTINIDNSEIQEVVDALCALGGVALTGVLATDAAAAKQVLIGHVVQVVWNYRVANATPPPAPPSAPATNLFS